VDADQPVVVSRYADGPERKDMLDQHRSSVTADPMWQRRPTISPLGVHDGC
jgi:hypothetical protein